jgi:multidrug efflux system membrane fusion protein
MDTRTPRSAGSDIFDRGRRITAGLDSRWRLLLGIIGALLLIYLLWLAWLWFEGAGQMKKPPTPVHAGVVTTQDMDVVENTIGTVLAEASVNVTAQVTGQLMAADFKEGQIVRKNDLLFQIDPRPFQAALDQATAALARDQANLVNAQNDERRFVALYAQNAISQSQRDTAVATAKADAAIVASDKAAVDAARINLGFTRIKSPVDGKTGPILIQPGNLAMAGGANPLVTVMQIQPVKVSFFLPQSDIVQIQNQMKSGATFNAVIPMDGAAGGDEVAPIDFVGNAVSAQTGTIELRATFNNADLRLVPGQTVNVGITLKKLKRATIVPRDAVNAGPDGSFIYLIDAQSKVQMVPVTVLNDDGTNDAVAGKLRSGQRVVVEGQMRLVPGGEVAVSKGGMMSSPAQLEPGAQ